MSRIKNLVIGGLVVVSIVIIATSWCTRSDNGPYLNISKVITDAKAGQVERIVVTDDRLTVTTSSGETYKARKEHGTSIIDTLRNEGVPVGGTDGIDVRVQKGRLGGDAVELIVNFLPLVIFGGIVVFYARRLIHRGQPQAG